MVRVGVMVFLPGPMSFRVQTVYNLVEGYVLKWECDITSCRCMVQVTQAALYLVVKAGPVVQVHVLTSSVNLFSGALLQTLRLWCVYIYILYTYVVLLWSHCQGLVVGPQ